VVSGLLQGWQVDCNHLQGERYQGQGRTVDLGEVVVIAMDWQEDI